MHGLQGQPIQRQTTMIPIGDIWMVRKAVIELPDYVFRVKAKGKDYYYFQRGRGTGQAGKRFRLPDDPHSPEFWSTYRQLTSQKPEPVNTRSFGWLIDRYQASPEYAAKALSTRKQYERHCKLFRAWWGDLEVSGITPRVILDTRDTMAKTPAEANGMVRSLSALLSWSVPRGFRSDNPCQYVGKLKSGDGWEAWPWEIIEWSRDHCPPWMWQAIALALYTGQRQSDVIAMQRTRRNDGLIPVRQQKTGKEVLIPIHRELRAVLDQIPLEATTYLAHNGKPWNLETFRTEWTRKVPPEIKGAGLVFHGLRKSAVVTLAEVGCTTEEIKAITGQSNSMVEHYAKQVNQMKLAKSAILRWENANRT